MLGTLVERSTRYVMLLHLPDGGNAAAVRDALITTLGTLPAQLRRSLTWDQGKEMARHREFSLATDIAVYFCDPHSPWQRGLNENIYWCKAMVPGRFDGSRSGGLLGDSENTCHMAFH